MITSRDKAVRRGAKHESQQFGPVTPNSNCTSAQASKSGKHIAGILRDGSVQGRSVILDSVT